MYWKAVPLLLRGERGEERLAPKTVRLIAGQARGAKVRANCGAARQPGAGPNRPPPCRRRHRPEPPPLPF